MISKWQKAHSDLIYFSRYSDDLSENQYWQAYQEVNSRMAQAMIQIKTSSKDLLWVNDLHLLFVPHYLRENDP